MKNVNVKKLIALFCALMMVLPYAGAGGAGDGPSAPRDLDGVYECCDDAGAVKFAK